GTVACSIASVNQSPGPIPVTDTFGGDQYYKTASASSTVNLPEGTKLVINPTTGTYSGPTTLSGTLDNTYTGQPVPGEPVTFTLGSGSSLQSCTGTTDASGHVSCTIPSVNQTSGTVGVTGSFAGNNFYSSSTVSATDTVHTPTTLTVSATTGTYGSPTTLTGD